MFTCLTCQAKQFNREYFNKLLAKEVQKYKGGLQFHTDTLVDNVGLIHALNMAENKYCGHEESFDPLSFFPSRFYYMLPSVSSDYWITKSAEICTVFSHKFNGDYGLLVSKVITSFRGSKAHWKILTEQSTNKTHLGCGMVLSKDGRCYCCLVFLEVNNLEAHRVFYNQLLDSIPFYSAEQVSRYEAELKNATDSDNWIDLTLVSEEAQAYSFFDKKSVLNFRLIQLEFKRRKQLFK